jgi:hypothetical protein
MGFSGILEPMKRYLTIIMTSAIVLMLFPFIALPEFWANFFVIIPAFLIAYSVHWIRKNVDDPESNVDSLELYIEKLQNRFRQQKKLHQSSTHDHE